MSAVPIRCAGGTPTMSGSYNKRPPLFPVAAATSATNGHKGVQYPSSSDSAASADPNVIYVYLKPNEEKPSVGHGHRQRLRDMRDSEEQVVMAPARKSSEAPRNTHDSAEHMAKELSFAPMMATSQERTPAAAERQNYAQQRQVQEPPPIMAPEEVLLANGASSRATPRLLTPSCQAMSPMRHDATPERMTQRSASRDVPVDDLRSTSGARQYGENQVYNSAQTFQTAQALPMHESQGVISRTPEPRAISPRKTPTPALQESNHDLFNSAQTDSLPRPYSEPTGNSQLLEPSVRGSRILSPLKQSVSTSRAPPKINTPNNDLWVSAQSSASPVFANLHTDSRATPVPAHIRDDVPLMSSYRESREQPPPPPPRLSPIAQNLREESLIMPSHRESRKTSQVGGRSTYRESDVQRSAHRNSERSLMMKAPVSRSSNAEISAIQETNVDLIMMGQQYSTDHLPQELFLNDERVVLWNSEDSLVLSPFSKSQHVSHLLHERVAMWNPLKNSFELSPSSGDEVKPPMKRKATVPQTELRSSIEPPRDARITPAQYASMRSRDDLPELYRSMANAPLIQTRHSTEFPGTEWGPILNDQPDALYEAFCGDVCEACEIHNDAVTDLSFSLGSLHVTYTVCHYATVPSADIKHRLNEFLFPRTNALYEHRSYSPNTRSSMGTGTQRQHDDQPRGSLVVARSEPMSNTESAVRSINAQMHERNAAGESGGRSTFLFPGTSAPLDHEYQSSRQMETEAIQERSHRGSVHTQPDTSRSAEAMPLASTVLVHGSAEVKPPGDAKDMNMSALSFARRESMKTVEVPEDRSKQPSVMEMQSRADGNYDTTRELHRNLDDSAKTPSTTEQQAQHASFAALPGRSEGNLQSTRELRNAMAATPTPEDGSTNYATKGMILPDDLYKVFAGLSTLHNPPTLSLAYPFNAVLHNLHSPLDMYHYSCRRFHVEPNMHAEDAFREWNVDKRHLTGRNSMEDPCNLSVVSHLNVAEMDLFTVGVLPILDVLRWCPSVEMLNFSNNQCTNATLEWLTFLIMGMDTVKYVRDSLRQSVKMVEENTMSDQQHLGSAAPRGLSDEVAEYLKNHEDDIVGRYGTPFSNLRVICADDNKFTHMAYRLGENLLRARPLLQKVELRGVALLPINGRVPKKNSRIFV